MWIHYIDCDSFPLTLFAITFLIFTCLHQMIKNSNNNNNGNALASVEFWKIHEWLLLLFGGATITRWSRLTFSWCVANTLICCVYGFFVFYNLMRFFSMIFLVWQSNNFVISYVVNVVAIPLSIIHCIRQLSSMICHFMLT